MARSTWNRIEGDIVGFEDQKMEIMNRLCGFPKSLRVISIVGMFGLGKTTLAKIIFNNSFIAHIFYIRVWITVSRVYQKRNLLLEILSSLDSELMTSDMHRISDEELMEALYKRLKGRRYLIVMDDMWSIGAWDDLKRCLPNDNNGSRIMFTSRIRDVASLISNSVCHDMRFLSNEEGWCLFQEKVFRREYCPPELIEVGKKIVKKCQGLPLSIVVVAGLLTKTEKTNHWWKQFEKSISSHVIDFDSVQYMELIESSYIHLPNHLKPLFLYFGAFSNKYEIPVSKLILLWIAEGLIVKSGDKNLEDLAEEYLQDLIDRCLLVTSNRKSNGGVKSCHVQGLMHDLCLRKVEEENFLQEIDRYEQVSSYSSSLSPTSKKLCRMCIRSGFHGNFPLEHYPNVGSLLCFDPMWSGYPLVTSQSFKLLRVLDLGHARLEFFPEELGQLGYLRYLAIQGYFNKLPPSISKLWKLETLMVKGLKGDISVDVDMRRMIKLRHLLIHPCALLRLSNSLISADLQTISTPSFEYFGWSLLKSTPNLRKLVCFSKGFHPTVEGIEFLHKLETLKMYYDGLPRVVHLFDLPASLRKITLSNFHFDWTMMSKLSMLPNLEILKLVNIAFEENWWDSSFTESNFKLFPRLKFLKFDSVNIVEWNASEEHFPSLQRLVLNKCQQFKEIPSSLGDIPTLQTIELYHCSQSVQNSVEVILEEQQDVGNEQLEIFIYVDAYDTVHSVGDDLSNSL